MREHRQGARGNALTTVLRYQAILFDVGGPLDMEFAHEMAVDSAIASACGMEGMRVDQATVDAASERAVAAFAPDACAHMIDDLCGGDPRTIERVERRVGAMVGGLDAFQLRPEIDGLLRRLGERSLKLGSVADQPARTRERLERAGIGQFFDHHGPSLLAAAAAFGVAPAACIMVGDRIDNDIGPAKALGMAAIRFRTGRHRRQQPRSPAETPDGEVTDVVELEAAILTLLAG